jgi:hypothetical protein
MPDRLRSARVGPADCRDSDGRVGEDARGRLAALLADCPPAHPLSARVPYLAIDDGVRDRAWVFAVSSQQYAVGIPGTVVHALVDPRRGALLEIRPLLAGTPD